MDETKFRGESHSGRPERSLMEAVKRGFLGRCPHCGKGKLFASFARTRAGCDVCGEAFHHHRADDLPAYLVIVVVGHVVVGAFMAVEASYSLTAWQHLAMWVPITILGSIGLLQPVKGAVVALQWALHMHGFGGEEDVLESHPEA